MHVRDPATKVRIVSVASMLLRGKESKLGKESALWVLTGGDRLRVSLMYLQLHRHVSSSHSVSDLSIIRADQTNAKTGI